MYMLIRRTAAIILPVLIAVLMPEACAEAEEGPSPIVENKTISISIRDNINVDTIMDGSKMVSSTEKDSTEKETWKWAYFDDDDDITYADAGESLCIEWHGKGKINYDDGNGGEYVGDNWTIVSVFDAEWSTNKPHGEGKLKYKEATSTAVSEWLGEKRHGKGIHKWANEVVVFGGEWSAKERESRDEWRIYLSLALGWLFGLFVALFLMWVWLCPLVQFADIKDHVSFYFYTAKFGETVVALSPEFDHAVKSPQKPNMKPTCQSVNSQTLWTDNPSLKTKKKMSGPSRRGKFGTLPLSIGESENIEGNLLGSDNVNLGVRVEKIFLDEDTGKPRLFYGIVTAHDAKYDFYKVSYEDGDEEEVTPAELEEILASKTAVRHGGMKKMKRDIGQILRLRRSCFE